MPNSTTKVILFPKPLKNDYYYSSSYMCPPKLMGKGCYGDCDDCYTKFVKWYERVEVQEVYKVK